jgi:hypothetical protein
VVHAALLLSRLVLLVAAELLSGPKTPYISHRSLGSLFGLPHCLPDFVATSPAFLNVMEDDLPRVVYHASSGLVEGL